MILLRKADDAFPSVYDSDNAAMDTGESKELAFNEDIDYAMLHKVYCSNPEGESRYSPAKCIGCTMQTIAGTPDPKHAFSKKLENHAAMVSLYFMYYNFGRVRQTLRVTPAMEG